MDLDIHSLDLIPLDFLDHLHNVLCTRRESDIPHERLMWLVRSIPLLNTGDEGAVGNGTIWA